MAKKKKDKLLLKKIVSEIETWGKILYLTHWVIDVGVDNLSKASKQDGVRYLAITKINEPYNEATMIFDKNIPPDQITGVVIHELTHLTVHPMVNRINDLLANRITQEEMDIFRKQEETIVSDFTHVVITRITPSHIKREQKSENRNDQKGGKRDETKTKQTK